MENELIDGLVRGNLVGGLAIVALLLGREPLRRLFGPALIYRFWLLPPLLAAASLLPLPRDGLWQALPVVLSPAADWPRAAAISAWTGPGVLVGAWGLGGAACALVLGLRQARFAAALGALQPVRDGAGVVWRAAHSNLGPALVGRAIVVPADFEARFTAEEQAAILAHERTHLARGDVLANALVALAQCLCWFNPLVHLAAIAARIDQELSCDAAVIATRPGLRRSYASALLKTQISPLAPPIGCTWPPRAQHPLKERIVMLKASPPTRARRLAAAGLLVVLTLGGGYAAWAAQRAEPQEILKPDWVRRPDGADVARVYPAAAARQGLGGTATMACGVEASGLLAGCRIERQSPEGAGFGDAALSLADRFQVKPAAGEQGYVRIPVLFRAPTGGPAR